MTARDVDEESPLLAEEGAKMKVPARTPIPWAQFWIVLVLQLTEPLTSQVIHPFAPEFIRRLGFPEAEVGYRVGLMYSLFFAAQALTVLHWSRISDLIGRKPVILVGLAGIALSMYSVGLSTTFLGFVVSRCFNGLTNGNIGVMKSMLAELTDETNMAQAYAYMPFSWTFGATIGPMIGGSLSRPADRFPDLFGHSAFLVKYPYFLPCAAPATFAVLAWLLTYFFLKETVINPTSIARLLGLRRSKGHLVLPDADSESLDSGRHADADSDPKVADAEKPYPLRALLIPRVLVAGGNYAMLSLVDIAFRGVLPLFLSTEIRLGGLGLTPPEIGIIMAFYGVVNGVVQIVLFAWIQQRWGAKNVFVAGTAGGILVFAMFPLINLAARALGARAYLVLALLAAQSVGSIFLSFAYGSIFIFISAAAPNRASLGSTNGLCQMAVSWMRALGPAISNSLFAMSLRDGSWTVYLILEAMALFGVGVACLLPAQPWKR